MARACPRAREFSRAILLRLRSLNPPPPPTRSPQSHSLRASPEPALPPSSSHSQYLAGARAPSPLILEMSTPAGLRKLKKALSPFPWAWWRLGGAAPFSRTGWWLGGAAPSLGRGGGLAAPWMEGFPWWWPNSATSMEGFPFPSSPCGGDFPGSSAWHDGENVNPSSSGSWDNNLHPSGGFMSYTTTMVVHHPVIRHTHNNDGSPSNENDNVRTEKRIMWTADEDVRVMSAWLEHSTDSTCGADKSGGQYWREFVETYNKTTPPL